MEWFNGMVPWAAASAGIIGLVGWAVGLKSFMSILEKVADIVAPLLKMVTTAIVAALTWTWNTIVWPGLEDIFDSWTTIATVLLMGFMLYGFMDHKVDSGVEELTFCQSESGRLERELKKLGKSSTEPPWYEQFRLW